MSESFAQVRAGQIATAGRFVVEDNLIYVRGSFPVMFDGQVLDRYTIELHEFTETYNRISPDWVSSA